MTRDNLTKRLLQITNKFRNEINKEFRDTDLNVEPKLIEFVFKDGINDQLEDSSRDIVEGIHLKEGKCYFNQDGQWTCD